MPLVYSDVRYKRLLDDLFHHGKYDKLVRPVLNHSDVINIKLLLYLSQVIKLDERMQTLQVNAWMTLTWYDEYLTWNASKYGEINDIKVPSQKVWMPDIVLYNNADEYKDYLSDKIVVVDSSGYVMWATPQIFLTSCIIDVTNFPFDEQTCEMKFGPWQYEGKELRISGDGDESVFKSDGQWDIVAMKADSNEVEYPDAPGKTYTDVTYTIQFKRRPLYYVFNMILPCTFVSLVALLTFFLPPESGEKISLGITVLLSLTVFLLLVAETMPPTSAVPVVGQFFMSTMALISGSLALSVAVLNMHHTEPDCRAVPHWVRRIILGYIASVLFPFRRINRRRDYISHKVSFKSDVYIWDVEELMNIGETSLASSTQNGGPHVPNDSIPKDDDRSCCGGSRCQANKSEIFLREILRETKKLASSYDRKKDGKNKQAEWRRVALVMDRVFLILFLAGTVMTFTVMFGQM